MREDGRGGRGERGTGGRGDWARGRGGILAPLSTDANDGGQSGRGGKLKGGLPGVGIAPSWEKGAFVALAIAAIVIGWVVVDRSAFSDRRRTDAGVFFRAGWAVREGQDPYAVSDENGWFYLYPPGMAVFLTPLAHAPPPEPLPPAKDADLWYAPAGYLPYPVSVAIWYALSIGCLVLSVRWMCGALERSAERAEVRSITPASGGWWNVRFWPTIAVLPDALSTLSRGQVNILLLALICLGVDRFSRGKRAWGGAAWALAACLKVFPGVFVFYLLARLDRRAMMGYIACGLACMAALPVVVYGPSKAVEHTWTFMEGVLLAGLGLTDAPSLQAGAGPENTDNGAIQGVLHNLTNIGTPRGERPTEIAGWIKGVHVACSLALLAGAVLVGRGLRLGGGRKDGVSGAGEVNLGEPGIVMMLRTGMLCCVMLAAVPMCHRHYLVLLYPAAAAVIFASMQRSTLALPTGGGLLVAVGMPIALAIPKASQTGLLRDMPIPLACMLVLYVLCAAEIRRCVRSAAARA